MKSRIFVSSTFYDLKYIREDLANFIKEHDFEPILFEDGDVGYTPNSALDESCYKAIGTSDMAILIVGGNYGSAATGEYSDDFKEFISVTRREFESGIEKGVPVFVFVDRSVYSEYEIYELNSKEIENGENSIKFRACKNINVFRFIREIRSFNQIVITQFDRASDIKEFLGKQWSDMFKAYLSSLKEQKEIEALQDKLNSMQVLIEKMDKVLDAVGQQTSKEDIKKQIEIENEKAEIKNACLVLAKNIGITADLTFSKNRRTHVDGFLNALLNMYLEERDDIRKKKKEYSDIELEEANILMEHFVKELSESGLSIRKIEYSIFQYADMFIDLLEVQEKYREMHCLLCSDDYYYRVFRRGKRESAS